MGRRRGERTDLELTSAVLDGNSDLRKERDARSRGDHLRERRKARRAKLALLRPGSVADRERLGAEAMPLIEEEHVLVVQITGGDALLPREPVPFRERHDEGVVRDVARGPLADVCLEREQAGVEPAFGRPSRRSVTTASVFSSRKTSCSFGYRARTAGITSGRR
jgi:hypothetical protein